MAAEEVKTTKAVVAKGRTVATPDGSFGPGEEVTLPVVEIGPMRKSGFLVDPRAKDLPRGEGPVFKSEGQGIGQVAA